MTSNLISLRVSFSQLVFEGVSNRGKSNFGEVRIVTLAFFNKSSYKVFGSCYNISASLILLRFYRLKLRVSDCRRERLRKQAVTRSEEVK